MQVFPVNTTSPKSDRAENGSELDVRRAMGTRTLRRVHSNSIEFESQETYDKFKVKEQERQGQIDMLRLRMKHYYNKVQITLASIYMIISAVHLITCSNVYFVLDEKPRSLATIVFNVSELICVILFISDHVIRYLAFHDTYWVLLVVAITLMVVNIVDLCLVNFSVADPIIFAAKCMFASFTINLYVETIEMNLFSHKYLD